MVVLGAQELHEKPFHAREGQVAPEHPAHGVVVIPAAPHPPERQRHEDRLVDLRRMDRDELRAIHGLADGKPHAQAGEARDGRRGETVRKLHGPGQRAGNAMVVIDEEASHAAQRVPQRERCRAELDGKAPGHAPPPAVDQDRGGRAEESAVPHKPAAPQQRIPLVGQQHVPDLRADESADYAGDHDVGRVLLVELAAAQIELHGPPGHEEGHHHHQAIAGEFEGPEADNERIDGHERPGRGRSARASRVQSLRSPSPSRYAPARAIIAALSVLRRGLATATRAMPFSRSAAAALSARLHATPPPSTAVRYPVARTARSSFVTSTSSTASWKPRAMCGRSRSRLSDARTACSTAVLSPENENSNPSAIIGRGKVNRVGSPSRARRSIAAPPGYPRPSRLATLSNASPAASSRVWPIKR